MNQICYVEHDVSHPASFINDVPAKHDWFLLILTHTPAEFLIDNKLIEYPADCMVFFPPNMRIYYKACRDSYKNDWIRFYSTESYIVNADIPAGLPIKISNPAFCNQLFQMLAYENFCSNYYREPTIENLVRILFSKLSEAYHQVGTHTQNQELSNLRFEIKNNPGFPWTVPYMADRLHISVGHFQALYRKAFNMACMEDVINNRIQLAKEHLAQSTYSITDIANICGYNNIEHFCRQFRKITGHTPNSYRRENTTLE